MVTQLETMEQDKAAVAIRPCLKSNDAMEFLSKYSSDLNEIPWDYWTSDMVRKHLKIDPVPSSPAVSP